jgi:thiol-disulfide isomerase/thioredoxin
MLKKPLSLIAYLTILIILGLAVRHFAINPIYDNPANNKAKISSAPLFTTPLTNIQGTQQNLSEYKGKIIVLNFWATWCPPCREEMPELSQLQQEYKNRNVVVLGIAEDELPLVKEYLQSSPVTYPVFIAENEAMNLGTNLGNDKGVLPYTVIIGADGSVIDTFYGRITKPLLETSLQNLLPK